MKNGLILENGELIYYKDGKPLHAGVIEWEGHIYYIGEGGKAVKGEHIVHKSMSNGLLKRGTYRFDDECKLIEGSYIAPKKKKNVKSETKKGLKISLVCFAVVFLIAFTYFAPKYAKKSNENEETKENSSDSANNSSKKEIVVPKIDTEVLLCSNAAKSFYDGELSIKEAAKTGSPYCSLKFEYFIYNGKNGKMLLSEKEDMSLSKEFSLLHTENVLTIDNLKPDTKYYYRILSGDSVETGSFKTAPSYRFVYMEGVNNTRDIGGVKTIDGKTLRYGMIIRGSEIDGLVESGFFLSKNDVQNVVDNFKFVYDFDLRNPSVFSGKYVSRFGESVKHDFYDCPMYGSIFNQNNKEKMKNIFSSLADENKYPMYLHCTHGADRTGTVVLLLQLLLGVDEESAMKEYRLTAFQHSKYADGDSIDIVLDGLKSYDGETLREKVYNYLVDNIGVTPEEIESIKNILLE